MSREICNECLGKQARDGKLSKDARERLVHRWRLFPGAAEHFRRDCSWWPRDGTPFLQRGIDFRTRIGSEGMSELPMLWALVSGFVVSLWAGVMMVVLQGDRYAGVASILDALTPVLLAAIGVFGTWVSYKILQGQKQIHTLTNDLYTSAKKETLVSLTAQVAALEYINPTTLEIQAAVTSVKSQIEVLKAEIVMRDKTAARIDKGVA